MNNSRFWALITGLTIVFPNAAATAGATSIAQGKKDRVASLVVEADRKPLAEAWSYLRRIEDLELSDDTLGEALQGVAKRVGTTGKLLVARGLLSLGEEIYGTKVVEMLTPILDGANPSQRIAGVRLLGNQRLEGRAQRSAGVLLAKIVNDDTADTALRLPAAKSLYWVGNATQKTTARRTLLDYLKSRDQALRVRGALAMYEIGDSFHMSARGVLEEIETEPTAEGRLAHAYLERERGEKAYGRLQYRLNKLLVEGRTGSGDSRAGNTGDFRLIRELLGLIEGAHIDGKTTDREMLIERAARGMLRALDPFSSYLTSDQYARFAFDLNRHYGGIGAFVRNPDGLFQITRPIYSGPAYKAGLLSGDRILAVDGWNTGDKELDEIIRRLKGKPDTEVKIKVWRAGWPEPKDLTLTRAVIQVPSVNEDMLPGKIGYVELIAFASDTSKELRYKLQGLKESGARAVIVDLRANSGGYLSQAEAVADLFLPKDKLIVYTKSTRKEERHFSRKDPVFPDVPIVVLINGSTASASEIVSGALQDHHRATIVGEQSYGKGSVQNLFRIASRPGEKFYDENRNGRMDPGERFDDVDKDGKFDPGPRARITIARYYLPSGRCLHKITDENGKVKNPDYGVLPDYELKARQFKNNELWKQAALSELWTEQKFHSYVDEHMPKNKKKFLELATGDAGSTAAYPGFDEFYESLGTQLSKDDVRRWIRVVIRERSADSRGKAWPGLRLLGDFQEDVQLQGAIAIALRKLGEEIADVPAYKAVLKLPAEFGKKKNKKRTAKKG
ncbi:MAG: S41 family peptidase [Planctomycetota bacterium]|jgi:carboxyl-terminal processing protease|nr:S41 family peptidase [Planctomycetota bacterium]